MRSNVFLGFHLLIFQCPFLFFHSFDVGLQCRTITQPKHQGASQAMLYATPEINTEEDLNKPQVGIASVW